MIVSAARLAANLHDVREKLARAAERGGRAPEAVRLVAVTKTVGLEEVRALHDLGVTDFGENRVAAGQEKLAALADPAVRWHLIGHLQRNKAAKAVAGFALLHGVESSGLIEALARRAGERPDPLPVLLEINISGEDSKYGAPPEEAAALARQVLAAANLRLEGLMTMAPLDAAGEAARPVFRALRELRDRLQDELGVPLPELSMGMSQDFEVAAEEGATLVRVGSALFAAAQA